MKKMKYIFILCLIARSTVFCGLSVEDVIEIEERAKNPETSLTQLRKDLRMVEKAKAAGELSLESELLPMLQSVITEKEQQEEERAAQIERERIAWEERQFLQEKAREEAIRIGLQREQEEQLVRNKLKAKTAELRKLQLKEQQEIDKQLKQEQKERRNKQAQAAKDRRNASRKQREENQRITQSNEQEQKERNVKQENERRAAQEQQKNERARIRAEQEQQYEKEEAERERQRLEQEARERKQQELETNMIANFAQEIEPQDADLPELEPQPAPSEQLQAPSADFQELEEYKERERQEQLKKEQEETTRQQVQEEQERLAQEAITTPEVSGAQSLHLKEEKPAPEFRETGPSWRGIKDVVYPVDQY